MEKKAVRSEYQYLLEWLVGLEGHVDEQKKYLVEMIACEKAVKTPAYDRYVEYLKRYTGYMVVGPEAHLEEVEKISIPLMLVMKLIETRKDFIIGNGMLDESQQLKAKNELVKNVREYLTQWPPFTYKKADAGSVVCSLYTAIGIKEYVETFISVQHMLPD